MTSAETGVPIDERPVPFWKAYDPAGETPRGIAKHLPVDYSVATECAIYAIACPPEEWKRLHNTDVWGDGDDEGGVIDEVLIALRYAHLMIRTNSEEWYLGAALPYEEGIKQAREEQKDDYDFEEDDTRLSFDKGVMGAKWRALGGRSGIGFIPVEIASTTLRPERMFTRDAGGFRFTP